MKRFIKWNMEDIVMQNLLKKKYIALKKQCHVYDYATGNVISIIKKSLEEFMKTCNNPAIWCYGRHTKMLMTDFIFELKKVRYIIDNRIESGIESGFEIIKENELMEKQIDGVIVSSRIYKDEIIDKLEAEYSNIRYLDIYAELEEEGIYLDVNYYALSHPHARYCDLNRMQRTLLLEKDNKIQQEELKKIIQLYVEIKDFFSAITYAEKLTRLSDDKWGEKVLGQLIEIYNLQQQVLKKIDEDNVLMLCVDGLRRKDITEEYMKNLYCYLKNNMRYFCNAYSVSTSTYESLIPAYSENMDLRTKYYEVDKVPKNGCRFINEAKRQKRKIFFYTDGISFIEDDLIKVTSEFQTATEKLWDFSLDAAEEKNGLFYVHILYESHFSYPNPYTTDKIIAEGTSIFFDYLGRNGGQLRIDYERQQKDSLRYLDEVIVPLIEKIPCRMVFYADHGNILLDEGTALCDIEKTKYTFHEDLIQVPFAIKSPEIETGLDGSLMSIMELNNVIIGLMNKEKIHFENKDIIKILRSKIYNPDFEYVYRKVNNEHGLLAFEVFVFVEGYKLAIYADGATELYLTETDYKIENMLLKKKLMERIKDSVTVFSLEETVGLEGDIL
jgi:hypothetical protein